MTAADIVAELRSLVEGAKTRPMSSSVSLNRSELLGVISRLEESLLAGGDASPDGTPTSGPRADDARRESERLVAEARQERDRLIGDTELLRVARIEADKERAKARQEADELRRDADDYVDTRLATFEVTLSKTLEAVTRGRERLRGRSHFAELSDDEAASGHDAEGFEPPPATG